MTRNVSATLAMALFLFTPNISVGESLILSCDIAGAQTLFGLNIDNATVKLLSLNEDVRGDLTIENRKYTLHFPDSDTRFETIVKIDRYYGVLEWEHGTAPFGEFNVSNIIRSGTCRRETKEPLF